MASCFDGLGMGLGFTVGLTCIGVVRELLGSGAIFGYEVIPSVAHVAIFVMAPGAFFVLAGLTALQNRLLLPSATNKPDKDKKQPEMPELSDDPMDNKAATMDDQMLNTVEEKVAQNGSDGEGGDEA